ncbi:MAG: hypothetical protein LBF08_00890 [Dysgonamonadaceae bacterium]|jgi:hypothetical protein|nr:hypothetical protein [Dysgonamonadaceae bacterium]
MKKIILLFVCVFALSSCYVSRVYHGNTSPSTPRIKVSSHWNHSVLFGLIPIDNGQQAATHVGGRTDYVTVYKHSFLNLLVEILTSSLYNPTTTDYYIPVEELKEDKK